MPTDIRHAVARSITLYNFPILTLSRTESRAFVDFWSAQYLFPEEDVYDRNIGKPLSEKTMLELYTWKNGGKLSQAKEKSVRDNYASRIPDILNLAPDTDPCDILNQFGGGMIWRIFLLHIWQPSRYPIFDQHVFRAMRFIQNGSTEEIPQTYSEVMRVYTEDYRPFHASLPENGKRNVDKALWSFGRFMNGQFRGMVQNRRIS